MSWDGSLKRKSDRRSEDEPPDIKTSLSLIGQSLKAIEETQERHGHILFGKDENKGGLILEVDRLIQHKKNADKTAYAAWIAFIGVIVKTGWDMIIKR